MSQSEEEDEQHWEPSESSEENETYVSPPPSESELVEPEKKQMTEEETPEEEEPQRRKRRKRRDHGPTGKPRGVPRGFKHEYRKRLPAKHVRETLDGRSRDEREREQAKVREASRIRRQKFVEKFANNRVKGLTSMEEECFDQHGVLPHSREAYMPPANPKPHKLSNVELFNIARAERKAMLEAEDRRPKITVKPYQAPAYSENKTTRESSSSSDEA